MFKMGILYRRGEKGEEILGGKKLVETRQNKWVMELQSKGESEPCSIMAASADRKTKGIK